MTTCCVGRASRIRSICCFFLLSLHLHQHKCHNICLSGSNFSSHETKTNDEQCEFFSAFSPLGILGAQQCYCHCAHTICMLRLLSPIFCSVVFLFHFFSFSLEIDQRDRYVHNDDKIVHTIYDILLRYSREWVYCTHKSKRCCQRMFHFQWK